MNLFKKNYQKVILLALSLIIVLIAVWPLFMNGFPENHDRNLYMTWLYEFDQNIREGNLVPRWAPNVWNGFGAPVFNFVQTGFYYLSELFHLAGLSLVLSVKAGIIISVMIGFIFMYLWASSVWKNNWAALAAATLYTWSPYHLGSIYLRGSFSELLAMAWWPLMLWAITKYSKKTKYSYLFYLSAGTALLLLSHNIMSLIFLPVALAYVFILNWKKWSASIALVTASAVGLGLSAFFWLPAFYEKKYLNIDLLFIGNRDYAENFINLQQLVLTDWKNYIFLLGLTNLAVFLLTLYAVVEKKEACRLHGKKIWIWLAVIVLAVFMSVWPSKFIWDRIELLHFFQFPWRFLALASFGLSALGGIFLLYQKNVQRWLRPFGLSLTIIFLTVFINYSYATPAGYLDSLSDDSYRPFREREAEIKSAIQSGQKSITVYFFAEMPEFFSKKTSLNGLQSMLQESINKYADNLKDNIDSKIEPPEKLELLSGDAEIRILEVAVDEYRYEIKADEESVMQVNTLWFPGWKINLNGQDVEPDITGDLGLMTFIAPPGENTVIIEYRNTPVRAIGAVISCLSILLVILSMVFRKHLLSLVKGRTTLYS